MADSDKNIRITTSKNKTTLPNIVFTGSSAGTSVLTLEVRDDNTVAFTGIDGDVFSLDYNLSTGTIWSVNDKSGTPLLRASAGGTIGIAELGSGVFVGIGQTNPKYKLDVQGWVGFASTGDGSYTILVENGLTTGSNALSIRSANALRFYNSGNTLYTGFIGAQSGVNTTYTLPPRTPTGTATSYLSSGIDGVMAWVAAPTSGGSGSVNSGTATYAAFYATTTNSVSENANLQFTGTGISIGGRINSTSTTSGSIYVYGGLGVTGNAFIGGTAYIPSTTPSNISNLLVSNNTSSTSTSTGALVSAGGLGIAGNAFIGGTVTQQNNTSSVGTNSGALTVVGGVGIAGNAFIGGTFVHQSSTSSVGTNSGSVTLAGGIGIAGNAFIGGTFVQQNNTSSVGTNSGALTVVGGVGIAGNAFIGGTTTIQSTQTSTSTITGALVVVGGVGIGGSLYTGVGFSSSISGVILANNSLTASARGTFSSSENSTTTSTGALVVTGGLGLGGNAFIGGTVYAPSTTASNFSNLLVSNNTATTSTTSGALVVNGGLGLGGNAFIGGTVYVPSSTASNFSNLRVSNTTSSTSTSSGALIVTGGLGIAGNAFIGGTFVHENATSSVGTNSGSVTLAGGIGIAGNAFIGGTTTITNVTASTSSDSGALVIRGGAAVGQTLSVGGSLNIFNGANYSGFRFAGSASTTYTLPPRTPTGTGTSYLSSSIDGVMAWVAAPTGGGPSGTINSSTASNVAFYSGSTTISGDDTNTFKYSTGTGTLRIASPDTEAVPNSSTLFLGVGTGATNFAVTGYRKTLAAFITNNSWTDGDLLVLGVAGAGTTQKFAVDYRGYAQIGVPGTGFTLPVTNGTSGQVLTANTNGVASWTTVSGSSGAGSGTVAIPGAQYQVAAYYWSATGASVSGSSTFTNNTATGVVNITHATESTSSTTGALTVAGGAGIAKSLFVGTTLSVGQAAGYTIPNNLASFVSTVNSYNQLVIQNRSNGTSASANLVVNNDISNDTTTYGEIGINSSTFSGTGALAVPNATYVAATSGPLVLGTTTAHPIRFVVNGGASDVLYISEGGTAISCFVNFGLRSASDLRFWNSGNTFYAGIQGGNTSASYLLSMPTGQVGAGASAIITGSDGQMYFVAPGSGIAFSAVNANTPALRVKRAITLQFAAGYTPLAAGPDNVILKIPQAVDGVSLTTYQLRELDIRVETPSAGTSRIQLEKYTGTTAFTLGGGVGISMIGGFGITLTGAAIHTTSISFASGIFTTTNDKLRLNWTLLNATHANFSIQLTMEEI